MRVGRFRNPLCYIDAIGEADGDEAVYPLCRIRHFDRERWSIAIFLWSNEEYEPGVFPSGDWFGTLRECVEHGGTFLLET